MGGGGKDLGWNRGDGGVWKVSGFRGEIIKKLGRKRWGEGGGGWRGEVTFIGMGWERKRMARRVHKFSGNRGTLGWKEHHCDMCVHLVKFCEKLDTRKIWIIKTHFDSG